MASLSICIPTYNRSACLSELLDSIIAQGIADVEVVVSDDASPDNTAEVAESYRDKIEKFIFLRQPQNIGLDRNFLAVVEAATSDYIWLMGDDDRLEPGGARRVLDAIERWPGIPGLTLGVIDYDFEMKKPTGVRWMPETQKLIGLESVFSTIVELLGFMSALVVRRDCWDAIAKEDGVYAFQNYYVQVYIIGRVIERYGSWAVIKEPCVGFRTSNDQFLNKFGWVKRLEIDVAAYDEIAAGLFGSSPATAKIVRKRIFDTHVMARLRNAKGRPGRTPGIYPATALLFNRYGGTPYFWRDALPTLFAPKWLVRTARALYKRFVKSSGAARARSLADPRAS